MDSLVKELKVDKMAYEQTLVRTVDIVDGNKLYNWNRSKKWTYGYHEFEDMVVISKTGQIGEVIELCGLNIALPKKPKNVLSRHRNPAQQYWERMQVPSELIKIKTTFEWDEYPETFKAKYYSYIDEEFSRREDGFWFKNGGLDTYITGSHYMYLQWSKIDVGYPDFRESNRLFFIFWEACKADDRCYGMCYLKNRRSGFSFMSSAETVNQATYSSDSRFGILSKTGADAKKMFVDKVVPISINYPFFFKPIQDGMDRPKTELAYRVPAKKFTRKKIALNEAEDELTGLDTTIDWKNTGDNSYDGEKLVLLVQDESGKWLKPDNIKNNWKVTKTCLRLGSRITGKCMMGSTSNALDKGGSNFKEIYYDSDVTKRNKNGQTKSGLYKMFIPMEWNFEGFIDIYGYPVFETPEKPTQGPDNQPITEGVIQYWENECEGFENQNDLNEFMRQFPRTEEHAFRDESKNSLYNLVRIYDQIDFNEGTLQKGGIVRGNFAWVGGIQDTAVEFRPSNNGRFYISWVPDQSLQNRVILKNGTRHPGNEHMGAFGCDPYDISGTVDGRGSNGALHGLTKFHMDQGPTNEFFLEYIARPQTAEIFFEDVLMACVFYGMPILAENNKPRLLYHFRRRGYRGFSMNRPDRKFTKLSVTEREIGGMPNSSEDIKQAHAAAIESYIDTYVGQIEPGVYGNMPFNRTLNDWVKFNINNRTKHDASISSGLAIMACNKHLYKPNPDRQRSSMSLSFAKYDNRGSSSRIVKR